MAVRLAPIMVVAILATIGNADVFNMPAPLTSLEMVPVGNPGNAGELSGAGASGGYGPDRICGAVDYVYHIGKYEVTAGQYTEFLNAVAATDTYGLYNSNMWTGVYGIRRSGSSGSYAYSVAADAANRPVNFVSWGDAARFANWLSNGQPTGAQGVATTEDGSYYLNGAITNAQLLAVTRKATARYAIPSEDEWYKAAYHKNDGATANYWLYPTRTDSTPGRDMTETTNPGNNANHAGLPFPIDSPFYTTVAGEFELSCSPYGTFDQGGNLWEWHEGVLDGSSRGIRGGSLYGPIPWLSAPMRFGLVPTFEGNALEGFRVVRLQPADYDGDGDVDLLDFDLFDACVSGPAVPYAQGCSGKDFDSDGDVDQDDFGTFQRCYNGEGNPTDPNCANGVSCNPCDASHQVTGGQLPLSWNA